MPNIINLNAEIGANYIGDDAQPALRIENSSTGPGLSTDEFIVTSTATIGSPSLSQPAATFFRSPVGNASVGVVAFTASGASVPVLELRGSSFVSAVSIIFAAGAGWAGMGGIRVLLADGITYGWIPVLPNSQFTAAVQA